MSISGALQLPMPEVFIDVAEDSGQFVDIDEWVLRKVVAVTRGPAGVVARISIFPDGDPGGGVDKWE